VTSATLTEHCLSRVASLDPLLHSFFLVTKDRALADAERTDRELKAGIDKRPMHGIPYALKDIYATAGIRTTCQFSGSRGSILTWR
jgi:aspartyl-tRNA(Asn)/glutamyl-tRNA(Gln) amidotransferase subunit A